MTLVIGLGWPHGPAAADPTLRDMQVIARAMGFLEPPPAGDASIGIVFPQQSEAGHSEALRIVAIFGDGLRAGGVTLRARPVTVEAAGQARLTALLLTDAALPQAPQIAAAVAGRSVLTVSTNQTAIATGSVVMVAHSEPRVEILVNRTAAQANAINFAAAFRMMIQER